MSNVYIVGLGMIRFNKYPDRTVRDMAHEVTNLALKDAGLDKAAPAGGVFFQHLLGHVLQPALDSRTGGPAVHGNRRHSGHQC